MKNLLSLICITTLALVGCVGTPTTYYQLPNSNYQMPSSYYRIPVQLKVVLADSLSQGNLVYQDSITTLHFAQNHLWADDLQQEITQALANEMNKISHHYAFMPHTDNKNTLTVYISAFQGSFDGHILIKGYSQWHGRPEKGQNFDIQLPQQGNGYNNMVKALAQGLKEVAASITSR
ncbi:MAG: membrane integrity-associated transporter subunit PqiC [Snodgrassella sp.]|nr:membrane integrity-associated transporter subunit PqiC [Snodgrassella sp.]